MNPDEYDHYLHRMHQRQMDEERGRKDANRRGFLNVVAFTVVLTVGVVAVLLAVTLLITYAWPVAVLALIALTWWAVKRLLRNKYSTGEWWPL